MEIIAAFCVIAGGTAKYSSPGNRCTLDTYYQPLSYYREGDIILGGILQICFMFQEENVNYTLYPTPPSCNGLSLRYLRDLLSFLYAIEEINNSTLLLPNVTLGFHIYDVCTNNLIALHSILSLLSGAEEPAPNYVCGYKNTPIAFVGHLLPLITYTVARITQLNKYPQISYGFLDSGVDEQLQFPYLYRTVPNEYSKLKAMIQLLIHFGWTWVGIVISESKINQLSKEEIRTEMSRNGICIAYLLLLNKFSTTVDHNLVMAATTITTSSANVIIVYCDVVHILNLLEYLSYEPISGKVWISSTTMTISQTNLFKHYMEIFNGSLILSLHQRDVPGFKDFLFSTTQSVMPDNIFLRLFWEVTFQDGRYDGQPEMDTWREFLKNNGMNKITYSIYIAIYALAQALHEIYLFNVSTGIDRRFQLNNYLKNIYIKKVTGDVLFFDEKGEPPGQYDIFNWVIALNGSIINNHVGSFFSFAPDKLLINDTAVIWSPPFTQTPRSVCSQSCQLGFRKNVGNLKIPCCFSCIPCSEGKITNMTDMDDCIKCPDDEWSNSPRNQCVKRPVDFLSYNEHLGTVLASFSASLSTITGSVLWIFVKHSSTPIVRTNNRNLSYILLVSLILSFLCPLLFIGQPLKETCLLRQSVFGIIFTVAISSVLGKTATVVIAFNATKPGSNLRKLVGVKLSIGLVLVCFLGEFMICIAWLIWSPPFIDYDTESIPGIIILQCNEGSTLAFYLTISYNGLLTLFSFCLAFFARKLPDNFNEAQYITFSMLVVCSAWVLFIPTYLSTKGKYMVAVEIFTILTSTLAIFGCIFIPKCYIIILKPERNIKEHLVSKI